MKWFLFFLLFSHVYAQAPTVKPTTKTPTTKSPTTKAPTSNPVTYSPTTTDSRLVLYISTSSAHGNIGINDFSDTTCASIAQDIGLACINTQSVVSFTYRQIVDLPTIMGFDVATPVTNTAGTSITTSWTNFITGTFVTSIQTALSVADTTVWSGSLADGSVANNNCDDFTTDNTLSSRLADITVTSDNTWLQSGGLLICSALRKWLCLCRQGTLEPTKAPTNSPTQPTPSPTQPPTTKSPTVEPTTSPTTSRPTTSPTPFPTYTPTSSPVQPQPNRYMYRLPAGTTVTVFKNYNNITYSHLYSTPTNITVRSATEAFIPIVWTNLVYRYWNLETNLTTTLTLTDPCNPGNPSKLPGTPTLQPDGVYTCPTTEKCILTADCTDELGPDSGYANWPDLRACWCERDEDDYPTSLPPDLPSGIDQELQLFEGQLFVLDPKPPPSNILGNINCANFIDREINCQLFRRDPNYLFQCLDEPIGCYDKTLGYAFGGFDFQNPLYPYPIDVREWTEGQYKGIASILNNLTYSKDGVYVDPFTSEIFNDYYWLSSNSSISVFTEVLTGLAFSSYQTYLIQADPFIYLLNSRPPPVIDYSLSRIPSDDEITCYVNIVLYSNLDGCEYVTWANQSSPAFHQAGVEYTAVIPGENTPLTVNVTFTENSPYIRGVEVYNAWGELCGSVYAESFLIGEEFVFLCLNTPSANLPRPDNAYLTVRVLGQDSIYDLPRSNLNSDAIQTTPDPLFPFLNLQEFTPYSNRTFPLMFPLMYESGYLPADRNWPQRTRITLDLTSPTLPFIVSYNYTTGTSNSSQLASAWSALALLITQQNVYPENFALRAVEDLFDTAAINLADPTQQAWLRNIWEVHLSRRNCGADGSDCQTFKLGECIVTSPIHQSWYNEGELTKSEENGVGEEGGCRCFTNTTKGFFSSYVSCGTCVHGYGPSTRNELAEVIQYNNLVSQTYTSDVFPTIQPDLTAPQFDALFICRYPFGVDPIPSSLSSINLCAGHGVVGYNTSSALTTVKVWSNKVTIACSSLSTKSIGTFTLSSSTTSELNLIYINSDDDLLMVIGTWDTPTLFLIKSISPSIVAACAFQCPSGVEQTFPLPWECLLSCEGETSQPIICENPLFFNSTNLAYVYTPPSPVGKGRFLYLKNVFLLLL